MGPAGRGSSGKDEIVDTMSMGDARFAVKEERNAAAYVRRQDQGGAVLLLDSAY